MRLQCRARAPSSLTQRVLRSQTILLDTTQPLCKAVEKPLTSRNTIRLSLKPGVAKSCIVEHTHRGATSIPGSTGRTPPAILTRELTH